MSEKVDVAHEAKVVRVGSVEGVKNQAVCACGWKGHPWKLLALAEDDTEDHLKEYAD